MGMFSPSFDLLVQPTTAQNVSNHSHFIPFVTRLRENIVLSPRLESTKAEFHLHPWPWPGLPEQTMPEVFYLIMALMLTQV